MVLVAVFLVSTPAGAAAPSPHDVQGPTLSFAGDLVPPSTSSIPLTNAVAVRNLVARHGTAKMIQPGDLQYECGTLERFIEDYGEIYGTWVEQGFIAPAIGNHEYCNGSEPSATGYRQYFGDWATPMGDRTYYSFNLALPTGGHVHILVLDSNCGQWSPAPDCSRYGAMANWIRGDLEADTARCEIAVWHEPAFGSSVPFHGDGKDAMRTIWNVLAYRGVDGVVSAHAHNYQRYGRMNYLGQNVAEGMPSFIIGTGGRSLLPIPTKSWGNLLGASYTDRYGFLKLRFTDSSHYLTSFYTTAGEQRDSRSYTCR